MSDSFATPWTVAGHAALSMRILQARILEWVAISFSSGSFQLGDRICISCLAGGFFITESCTDLRDTHREWPVRVFPVLHFKKVIFIFCLRQFLVATHGIYFCGSQALKLQLSSCSMRGSVALEGRLLTIGPPGKSPLLHFLKVIFPGLEYMSTAGCVLESILHLGVSPARVPENQVETESFEKCLEMLFLVYFDIYTKE